jgi:hypothetical protein
MMTSLVRCMYMLKLMQKGLFPKMLCAQIPMTRQWLRDQMADFIGATWFLSLFLFLLPLLLLSFKACTLPLPQSHSFSARATQRILPKFRKMPKLQSLLWIAGQTMRSFCRCFIFNIFQTNEFDFLAVACEKRGIFDRSI